jgi:AI-2 transport protein TqsA
MADAVNLSLTVTFLSLVFWAFVIGPLGAVLAVPLTLLAKALLLDVDPDTRWMSSLVTGGLAPSEDPDDAAAAPPPQPGPEIPTESRALAGDG